MKKVLLLPFVLLAVCSFGQKFTLTQLQKLYDKDDSFFDTYAIQNNYQFASAKDSFVTYNYHDGSLFNRLEIETLPGMFNKSIKERCIAWTFTSDENYLAIKKELSDNNYQLFKSLNGNNDYTSAQHFYYTNKVYVVHLTVAKMNFMKVPVYVVVIRKV